MEPNIIRPLAGNFRVSFRYGEAPAWYVRKFGYPHNGVDFACPIGQSVKACDKGTIIATDDIADNNGKGIIIAHTWGTSLYWHMSECTARAGAVVNKGQEIGKSGDTGFVTGPHLHFGIKIYANKNPAMRGWSDPLLFIENKESEQPQAEVNAKYYIVRPGDSLYKIALKIYGQGYYWGKIYEANRDKIKNPSMIYPLQKLFIP